MTRSLLVSAAMFVCGTATILAADPPDPPKAKQKVREFTTWKSGSKRYEGVVEKIDKDGMTLVEVVDGKEPKEHQFVPVDILRRGEVMPEVFALYKYRWEDVKRGDLLWVEAIEDKEEGVTYCLMINIKRRPNGKLPKSQEPERDKNYRVNTILNDIDNGEDVSDDDIAKALPPTEAIYDEGRLVRPARPGGLNAEYQKKLDAIRAKKSKEGEKKPEVKAPPPADKK